MTPDAQAPFLVTVDVEPDWGMAGTRSVREALPRLVELFRRRRIRATFFIVANLLDECAALFRELPPEHEVASHGLTHRMLDRLPPAEVARELSESRRRLEAELDRPVFGFRAPFLRTPRGWFEALAAAGYKYDSSLGAVAPSSRNRPPSRWRIVEHAGVAEIPATSLRVGWIPFSLTYLRLLAPAGERLISPRAVMMYFHLHELMEPPLAGMLPWRLRWLLRRNAGAPAWVILDRVLERFAPRAMTCRELTRP